jgi:hypothetical protein
MLAPYSYRETLEHARRTSWSIDEVLPPDAALDFDKPFLPESLALVESLDFLDQREQRTLSQIRGKSYLGLFGLVEEFILPFVLDHARGRLDAGDDEVRALLQFAGEEAKHIHLFKRFSELFERDFGTACGLVGPSRDFGEAVLAHSQLGVALLILHIEWMTQRHYLESAKSDTAIDPLFQSLLKHHWIEEAQHAKLDTLVTFAIAGRLRPAEVRDGLADYRKLGAMLDDALAAQVGLDLDALQTATGRELRPAERAAFIEEQRRAYRWTFLESGATHPSFRRTLEALAAA